MRLSDVTGRTALFGNPAAGRRVKGNAEFDLRRVPKIADEVWRKPQHHGGFPFASVPHLVLGKVRIRAGGLRAKIPVSCEETQHVVTQPLFLAQLEDGLASGDIIPAVAVDEEDPAKTVLQKIVGEPLEQIEIDSRRGGKRAVELEMMMRIA